MINPKQWDAFQSPFGDFLICKKMKNFGTIVKWLLVSVPVWGFFNL